MHSTSPVDQPDGEFASIVDPIASQPALADPINLAGGLPDTLEPSPPWAFTYEGANSEMVVLSLPEILVASSDQDAAGSSTVTTDPTPDNVIAPTDSGSQTSGVVVTVAQTDVATSPPPIAPDVVVSANSNPGPVSSQGSLILVAGLAKTTSPILGSSKTNDDTIAGRAIDTAAITALTASIDGGAAVNEIGAIGAGGGFTLTPAMLATLAGGTLADGAHTVLISATDANANTTTVGVPFTLDSVTPTLSAGLMTITGTTTLAQTIGATSNATVAGTGSDNAGIISLFGTLDGITSFANLTGDIGGNGAFTITPAVLASLGGGTLADGAHSLVLQTTDTAGNVTTRTVNFTLETQLGVPTLALAASDQTVNATTTGGSAITLLGTTTPGAIATLTNTGAIATAGATGLFQFTNVPVAPGGSSISVQVTDLAGNSNNGSLNVAQAASGGTDPVLEWDAATRHAITVDASPPTVASRALAIESLSVYNAVAAINGTPGFSSSLTAPAGADARAATIAAANKALDSLYPAQASGFDAQAATDLAAIPNSLAKTEGIAVGQQAAAAMLALRANDGTANNGITDLGSTIPGQWQMTAPAFMPALTPQWATATPFALQSPSQFLPSAPPDITSPAYAAAVNQTFLLGDLNSATRTPAETQKALFFNDQTGTDTPAGQWNQIAAGVAQTQGLGLSQDALLFAELNVAEADAAIAAWNGKFTYNAWRPITLFDNSAAAGNPAIDGDPNWRPLIVTPPFPEYPEGHGTFSGAAATVLANFFGDNTSFSATSQSTPGVTLNYTSFSAAANDAAMSRIWGGIHFTFSASAALTLGGEIGQWTLGAFNSAADTTPPKVTLNNPIGGMTKREPTVTGVVSSSFGVSALDAIENNGTAVTVPLAADGSFSYTVQEALDGSADGNHVISFVAVDPAGIQSPVVNYSFSLFTKAPTISLAADSVKSGSTIGAGALLDGTLELEAGDTFQSLTYAFDGGTPNSVVIDPSSGAFDTPLNVTKLTPGQHSLTVVALDTAGNTTTQYLPIVYKLPPLVLTGITPSAGDNNIGVTYRPSISFSRAVNPASVNGNDFFATDSTGAVLPATVLPFSDGTGAWLLPTGDWPGASTISLHVVGQSITAAADGMTLDAAGVGAPGSTLTETYTTVSNAPVFGTSITGLIVDPGPDGTPLTPDDVKSSVGNSSVFSSDTWKLPIVHAKVFILGDEQDAVFSGADGSFTLSNVPTGDVKVVIDGTTATNAPAGYFFPSMTMDISVKAGVANTIPGAMGSLQQQAGMAGDPAVYLPRVASDTLTTLSTTAPTVVTAPSNSDLGSGAFTLTQQQLASLSLTVQPNSVVDANGNPVPNAQVGIAPVPASIVQDMLPAGLLQHSFDITIQAPGGSVFTSGASLTMPNVFGLAPGQKTYILSFDHTTGRLVIDGTATASADGKTVTSDADTTIMAPGWHGITPNGSNGNGKVGDLKDPNLFGTFLDALDFMSTLFGDVTGGVGSIATLLQADGTPAIPALNVLSTAADTVSLFADYNNPNKTNGDVAYDALKVGLDVASFIPPVALAAGGLRLALGLFDLFHTNGPALTNDIKAAGGQQLPGADFSTLFAQVGAVSSMLAMASGSAFPQSQLDALLADQQQIDAEMAIQKPVMQQVLQDVLTINALQALMDPTKADGGLSAAQTASLRAAALDIANQAALVNGHPSILQLATKFVADGQALFASIEAASFEVISPPVFARGVAYAVAGRSDPQLSNPDGSAVTVQGSAQAEVIAAPEFAANLGGTDGVSQRANTKMYVSLKAADGSVLRQSFTAGNGYNFFLQPNTYYEATVYDPSTGKVGSASFKSAASGQDTNIPVAGLMPDDGTPGADGLTPRQAYVIGVNSNIKSNLVPGITDVSAIQQGLFDGSVLPGTTGLVASLPLNGSAQSVVLSGSLSDGQTTFAYVATGSYGLAVVDVSNPFVPVVLGQLSLGGNATGVAVSSALGIAVVATGAGGIKFVDISNPAVPAVIGSSAVVATMVQIIGGLAYVDSGTSIDSFDIATGTLLQTLGLAGSNLTGFAVSGSTLYTMDAGPVLRVIDTSSGAMVVEGSVNLPAGGNGLTVGNGVVYVAAANGNSTGGYLTVNVSNPAAPTLIEGVDSQPMAGAAIALNGSGVGLTVQTIQEPPPNPGLHNVADLINTSNPAQTGNAITRFELPAAPAGVAIAAGIGFIADTTSGLQVLNYLAPDLNGVPPGLTVTSGPTDVDPVTAGIQVYEGLPISIGVTVTDDVQVRNVALLVGGTVAANSLSSPFSLTATMPKIATLGLNAVSMQVEAIDTGGNTTFSSPFTVQLVPDTRPLQLISQSMGEGAILSQFDHTISLTFSKPLDPTTVTTADFQVTDQNGVTVTPQSLVLTGNNQVVRLNYPSFAVGAYHLVVDATQVADINGVVLGAKTLTTDFTVQAFSSIFTNTSGGSWNTPGNWNVNAVPGATDAVYIGNAIGAAVSYDGGSDSVAKLVTNGSGLFQITAGALTVTNLLQVNDVVAVGNGSLNSAGTTNIGGLGAIDVNNRSTSLGNVAIDAG